MSKQPRTKKSGKEVRYILKQSNINLAWLSEQLGITPQTLNSRLNAEDFKPAYMLEINNVLNRDLFDISSMPTEIRHAGQQPIIDVRVSAGMGIGLDGNENKINEYVSIPSMNGCIGLTIYGESMSPRYRPGDVVFVRPILNQQDIDYGRPSVRSSTACTKNRAILTDSPTPNKRKLKYNIMMILRKNSFYP